MSVHGCLHYIFQNAVDIARKDRGEPFPFLSTNPSVEDSLLRMPLVAKSNKIINYCSFEDFGEAAIYK